jgi:RimJ/RimL family protein N-acetyltransferase
MRVYLRAFEIEDYKKSIKWRNDQNIWKSTDDNYFFVSSEREKKWIENAIFNDKNNIRLAICLKENNKYIGNVNLLNIEWINRQAEFSIFIGEKKEWKKGYATEATKLMVAFGFNQRNLNRIYLTVLENNKVAIYLYEKIGFKKEGILREALFKDNKYYNLIIMSILKEEYSS